MTMTKSIRALLPGALLLLLLFVSGCAGAARPLVTSLSEVEPSEVIVVGKIVLDPPLEGGEQSLETFSFASGGLIINPSASNYRNCVTLLTDRENREITDLSTSDYRGRIEAALGETFYVRAANEPFYVIRSEIWMSLTGNGMEKAILPSGYRIDIRPGDKAVYIGTIKYHRDEFFGTSKVELIDEFKKEQAAFRMKFGDGVKLRKAMIVAKQKD